MFIKWQIYKGEDLFIFKFSRHDIWLLPYFVTILEDKISDKFYWPKLGEITNEQVVNNVRSIKLKTVPRACEGELISTYSQVPMKTIYIDEAGSI